jgi:hypothetical protein
MTSLALISVALIGAVFFYGYICLRQENAFKNCFLEASDELLRTSNIENEERLRILESFLGSIEDPVLARDSEKIFSVLSKARLPENERSAIHKIPRSEALVFSAFGNLLFGALFSRPWTALKVSFALLLKGKITLLLALYRRPRSLRDCPGRLLSQDRETRAQVGREMRHVTQRRPQHAA